MGQPSKYTPEIVATICERLAQGTPLVHICRDDGMPSVMTVWNWEQAHDGVTLAIARAREAGEEVIAASTLDIADDVPATSEDVQKAKLRVDTRLKLLAKWNPRKWGDRTELNHTGKVTLESLILESLKPPT